MKIIVFTQNQDNCGVVSGILQTEGHISYDVTTSQELFELIELNNFSPELIVFDIKDAETIIKINNRAQILLESRNIKLNSMAFLESKNPEEILKLMAHNLDLIPTALNINYLIAKINAIIQSPSLVGCASLKSDCFLHKQSIEKQEFISHQIAMIHNSIVHNTSDEVQSEILKSYLTILDSLKNSIFTLPISNEENYVSHFSIFSYIQIFFSTYNRVNNISVNLPEEPLMVKVNKQYFVMALNKILIGFIKNSDHNTTISINYSKAKNSISLAIINCSQQQSINLSEVTSNEFLIDVIHLNGWKIYTDLYPDCFNLTLLFQQTNQMCNAA